MCISITKYMILCPKKQKPEAPGGAPAPAAVCLELQQREDGGDTGRGGKSFPVLKKIWGGSTNGGYPQTVALFHGKSQSKVDYSWA